MHRNLAASVLAAAALFALGACGDTSAPDGVDETPMPVEPDGGIGDGAGPPLDATDEMEQTIPAPLQGRWGMVSTDCTSDRSDAKGLLMIDAQTLKFYESVGTLAQVQERDASHIVATFDYTGEGMEWSRVETLRLVGATLTRSTDSGDAQGPFTYERCA